MKWGKSTAVLLALTMSLSLAACTPKKAANQADSSPAQGAQTQSELQPEAGLNSSYGRARKKKHSPNRLPRSLLKNIM
ncbi:hypothetical protein [Paenibacillus larvae]|uniref:hypothetical protein n=1 Tax=Paenibacillus larvae TaxID=1464 RepID=UPI001314BB57|nr:hypothetical protein [Paenibacillus larvae]